MTTEDALQKAEEKAKRAEAYRDKLIVIKRAEAEIPGIWDTGQVPMAKLAETYGISTMTVRRILQDAGREITRFKKLTQEERIEVVAHLKNGLAQDELAAAYHVSRATIRRIGVEAGVITKGYRKPRRSDEDYLLIQAFDAEARQRFNGAGLYNLGMGLRQWQQKKKAEGEALAAHHAAQADAPEFPEGKTWPEPEEPVQQWVPTGEPLNQGSPAPAPSSEPVPEPVVFGDGEEDAAAVVGPFADQAKVEKGFNF